MKTCRFLTVTGTCKNECGGCDYGKWCPYLLEPKKCYHYTPQEYYHVRCHTCNRKITDLDLLECKGYGRIKITFGHGSRYDNIVAESYHYKICDDCYEKIFLNPIFPLLITMERKNGRKMQVHENGDL